MQLDDERLMAAVAEGDERAFAILVQRHLPRAYAIARRVLPEQADAEDAAQEAFTRIWTHAADWQPGRALFTTWLQRILVNQCLDQLRRRERRPEQRQVDRRGAAADKQRMAVVLCYFEEHSTPGRRTHGTPPQGPGRPAGPGPRAIAPLVARKPGQPPHRGARR